MLHLERYVNPSSSDTGLTASASGVENGSAAANPSVTDETLNSESSATAETSLQTPVAAASEKDAAENPGEPRTIISGIWQYPAVIAPSNFKFKSLCEWAFNSALGCAHGCRFCYVPSTSTNKQGARLGELGVTDPDAQWGEYVFPRLWDEKEFLASLRRAENTSRSKLKPDGHRAILLSSTTDAYQVINNPDKARARELTQHHQRVVRDALERIRDHSTLNVRILTRSPLAKTDFAIMKSFGNRLMFGMSLPTLNDNLARIYEPNAPSPTQRLKTLREAKEAGLNVYVAIAPTYPECDEDDLRATLKAVAELKPHTVFHENINIRAENVARIAAHAATMGMKLNTAVFDSKVAYWQYSIRQLKLVERIAGEVGLAHCLHLWPDASLKSKNGFMEMRKSARLVGTVEGEDDEAYAEHLAWVERCHARISEWPKDADTQ